VAPCDKLNLAALGNIVRQLHVHVVARVEGDAAWPGPVWGNGRAQPYPETALAARLDALHRLLAGPAG
jgi:diadenosine tetraphosphate (Ap4A) HIT family hydrolase